VRLTPVQPLLESLKQAGIDDIRIHDPMVLDHDASKAGVEMTASLDDALDEADCVAFLAGHDDFHNITPAQIAGRVKAGALVFDGRIYFDKETIAAFVQHGLVYRGVGR
jgi:UDP-N-acetyl-D-mannosaminuronic acid dehydrogenase